MTSESTPCPKVFIHHIKVGNRYIVKNELHIADVQMTFSVNNVFMVEELHTGNETKIIFKVEHLEDDPISMSYAKFCELIENGTLVKQDT